MNKRRRRLVILCAMLAALSASSFPAAAEETGVGVITRLGSTTTLGGFVNSSPGVGLAPTRHQIRRAWWHILYRLGF